MSTDTFLTTTASSPHLKGGGGLGGPALDFELPSGDGAAAVVPDPTPSIEELERVQHELLAADAARRDARSRAALQEALANHKNSDHERQSLVAYLDELRGRDDEAGAVRAPPTISARATPPNNQFSRPPSAAGHPRRRLHHRRRAARRRGPRPPRRRRRRHPAVAEGGGGGRREAARPRERAGAP